MSRQIYGPIREQLALTPAARHQQDSAFKEIIWNSYALKEARFLSEAIALNDALVNDTQDKD